MRNDILLFGYCLFWLFIGLFACRPSSSEATDPFATSSVRIPELVEQYCGNCHLTPAPDLLPKKIWLAEILPRMGAFYGHYERGHSRPSLLRNQAERPNIEQLFPERPSMDSADWAAIKAFYVENAPRNLAPTTQEIRRQELSGFTVRPTYIRAGEQDHLVTLVQFDAAAEEILIGESVARHGLLSRFNKRGDTLGVRRLRAAPSQFDPTAGNLLSMGNMNPNDLRTGQVLGPNDSIWLDSLARPVDMCWLDMDQDGVSELVVAEYGNLTGFLNVYKKTAKGYQKWRTLSANPGAIQLEKADIDGDGLPDLLALMAQGDEGIFGWRSSKGFESRNSLIRFPPSYGSAQFKLVDFDGDGDLDILYANGDNFDYQPVPKAYHGIRFYANEGSEYRFKWHYHLDGAYGLEVADFDADGDMDIAAIAYFVPPEKRSYRSFVYLEQTNTPTQPEFVEQFLRTRPGLNFMRMAAGDVDKDGDQDLLLGNFSTYLPDGNTRFKIKTDSIPVYVLLENQLEQPDQ